MTTKQPTIQQSLTVAKPQEGPVGYVYSDKGIKRGAIDDQSLSPGDCLYAAPQAQPAPEPDEMSPDFTDTARNALLWVLWHHQGASSKVGQAMRFALGMGDHDRLNGEQIARAKSWAAPVPGLAHEPAVPPDMVLVPLTDEQIAGEASTVWDDFEDDIDRRTEFARAVISKFCEANGIGEAKP